MREVVRTASTRALPLPFAAASLVNTSLWAAYGYAAQDLFVLVPNSVGVCSGVAQFALFARYGVQLPERADEEETGRK